MLLLLPQRNLALRAVRRLCALAVRETRTDTIQNKQRLEEEFGDGGEIAGWPRRGRRQGWWWRVGRRVQGQRAHRGRPDR